MWKSVLADILKKDYHIEKCPKVLRDEFGKPYLEGCDLNFNVSHSGEYLAIAVSKNPVGVDIQKEKKIREVLYRKVVQEKEQELIGEDCQKDFLRLWTLKESFIKAEGKGFRISLKDYYFEKEDEGYCVNYSGQRSGWLFYIEETLMEDYVVSVCGLEKEVRFICSMK